MIVIDSSALVAILQFETERSGFFEAIAYADRKLISAVTFQETSQVIYARLGADGLKKLDKLLESMDVEIVAHDEHLARLAVTTFCRYGKGIDPKASLNFGDCAAYALAKHTGAPLLYKGSDFAATDIVACLPPTP